METMYIKNMVCDRCIMAVRDVLGRQGIEVAGIRLGEVDLPTQPSAKQLAELREQLQMLGFDIIDDRKSRIISQIKNTIIELVHHQEGALRLNLSEVLRQKLHHDYQHLSALFSEVEGTTIEKYHIAQKIERAKELLVYDELSLSEIAFRLNYSSVSYLSNQFKRVTGLTPSHFRQVGQSRRQPLDRVGGEELTKPR